MILQPIDLVVYPWLVLAVLSALYVAYDQFRHNPEAPVMKWGFVLVTLSTVHCVASDATGIIAAAVITAVLGFPMWVDVVAEYVFGFLFGLLVFQALFMRGMMGGSYAENVRRSFMPELSR